MEGRKPTISPIEANKVIEEYFNTQQARLGVINSREGEEFLERNKREEGIIVLESGLQYKIIKQGNGHKPKLTDKVKCHYHGTLINGAVFDSSVNRGEPAIFPVNAVIKGWIEALQLMSIGSKWQLFIPPHLAYGDHGTGALIGPKSTLIFDVELLKII
jgi:FKBP-type peptidyl-prolyl cis-trans isomerase FklB